MNKMPKMCYHKQGVECHLQGQNAFIGACTPCKHFGLMSVDKMTEGTKVRLTEETIQKFNVPKEITEGVVHKDTPSLNGALIKHSDGKIFGWDYKEFEVVKNIEEN